MSEHHSTPLSQTPSPGVFLAAVAQRTRRLRLGRIGLRAAGASSAAARRGNLHARSSERRPAGGRRWPRGICPRTAVFRHRSGSGAGHVCRGLHHPQQALTQPEVNFNGRYYNFENVPIEMKPAQLPHPPFWYAVPVPDGAAWPAQNNINIVCAGPVARVREITDRYRAEWMAAGNSPDDMPLLGINRFVIAADTDREAMALGRRAWPVFSRELHEALEQARHAAALCKDAGRLRYHGRQWRRSRGISRHHQRPCEAHGGCGGRELFHRTVFLRRPVTSRGAPLRGHLRPRAACRVAGARPLAAFNARP